MILKILIFNLIVTFGLLATGNIGWGIILHVFNTSIAVGDHVLNVIFEDEDEDGGEQPPNNEATV